MKIGLLGYGRMGKTIEKIALDRGHEIVWAKDIEAQEIEVTEAEVAIDFSHPNAAYDNIMLCLDAGVPVVSGTTGWLDRYQTVVDHCEEKQGTLLYASNFSIGVNIFFELNKKLAAMMKGLDQYKVRMKEIHHVHKLDAPSGTAITLAEGIMKEEHAEHWTIAPEGSKDQLFIEVERQGEVPGTHEVHYDSSVDSIEIKHTAHSRLGFALGAVVAAEWLKDKKGVFSMSDVLSI